MSQGRGGWVRTVIGGIAVVLCAGAIGCTDVDKPKDKLGLNSKQPGPGLPGTPRLQGTPGSGLGTAGQPGAFNNMSNGVQPGGVGTPAGRGGSAFGTPAGSNIGSGSGSNFGAGSPNGSMIPPVGPAGSGGYAAPAGGYGSGSANGGYGGATSPPAPNLTDVPVPPSPPGSGFGPVSPPTSPSGTNYNYR